MFTADWICTVIVPLGTLDWNWLEVTLYLTPLIRIQTFPVDVTLSGMLIVRVGPTLMLNVATLFA